MSETIAHYTVLRQLGRGGMGIVYEARDERLQRPVALKKILPSADPLIRERFLREARAAAAVSHPHICQLFEIGEHQGEPYLAMELLEGESLAARLERGPLAPADAVELGLSVLSALEALHRRGIVHRDLKPSNIFLTPHGVKLLDFGLARPVNLDVESTSLTMPGLLLGTPRYMAPEQARGGEVDARADIFAAGAVLFEMLTARPAFGGDSPVDVLHAVLNEQPPALVGSPAIVELDRILQRALAKPAADRYQAAEEMARELRACLSREDIGGATVARASTRLVVLPFRVLRPDASIDFLAFSLPDAITVSLSMLDSLVVRSSLTAAKLTSGEVDLDAIARLANVDAVVTGSLVHAGGQLRVTAQVIDAPSGTVRWSRGFQGGLDDLFGMQDSICSALVEALAVPVSAREAGRLKHDVPANPEAYAHYLQANRLSTSSSGWDRARELYEMAIQADPSYAPAWARLGRCLRLLGKYGDERGNAAANLAAAEEAFQRAFALNSDLPLAHNLYTYAEVDSGRAVQAVTRLLGRIKEQTSDPQLYAGLVQACRYVGLLDASLAADARGRRLDPTLRTSVAHTHYMNGDFAKAIETDVEDPPYVTVLALAALGRLAEAVARCRASHARAPDNRHLRAVMAAYAAMLDGDAARGHEAVRELIDFPAFTDPEGFYYWAHASAGLKDHDGAFQLLARAVEGGFSCVRGLETPPAFDSLRRHPRFVEIVNGARASQSLAARAFADADGHRLLGLPVA